MGLTCLARGAGQIFAQVVLDLGGAIEVILASGDYGDRIRDPASRARYDAFVSQAAIVTTMPFDVAGPEAHMAASVYLVSSCDLLVAVWDGSPPDRRGGTADVVDHAEHVRRETIIVWPRGASEHRRRSDLSSPAPPPDDQTAPPTTGPNPVRGDQPTHHAADPAHSRHTNTTPPPADCRESMGRLLVPGPGDPARGHPTPGGVAVRVGQGLGSREMIAG